MYPADVVLFEGILVFYTQEVRDMFHMKLFVDTDSDVRLSRRGIDIKKGGLVVVRAFDSQLISSWFKLPSIQLSWERRPLSSY